MQPLLHRETTDGILAAFFGVYNTLGAGFVERVYGGALAIELRERGLRVDTQVPVTVLYRGVEVGKFRADIVVESTVLVELKAAERLAAAHEQQVLNYLHATNLEVGLLLNFGPKPAFKRFLLTNDHKKPL
ncbi:MAG TPA: GxxExxY protein [Gemmatimonadaceae bacterium]|nr:GxxExxY protein [Gemmatimonadaceae bacterium]